ncbi:MAG: M48 family metalloprotease [Cyanobacteria bacterium P01_F01_bin.150]
MNRIVLHLMTVVGSGVFYGGLALFMAAETLALPSESLKLAKEPVTPQNTVETFPITSFPAEDLSLQTTVEELMGQVVPTVTPVTPQDVTPQTIPDGGVFPERSPDADSQETTESADPTSPIDNHQADPDLADSDLPESDAVGSNSPENESTDLAPSGTDTTAADRTDNAETDADADADINIDLLTEEDEASSADDIDAKTQTLEETTAPQNSGEEQISGEQTNDSELETNQGSEEELEGERAETTGLEGQSNDAATEDTTTEDTTTTEDDEEAEELTAEELERQRLLIEGDRLFLEGKFAEAEELYRQAKDPFHEEGTFERQEGFSDPEQLSPAGAVYWREYQAGLEAGLDTRTRIPLALLREQQPEFIPGHMAYAQVLVNADEIDEALEVLEQATALYPDNPELATTRVDALVADEQWLQAAIASRQFALLEPDHPDAEAFQVQADEYQDRFRRKMRRRLTRTAIGNAIAGAAGFAFTGSWFGPLSALETTVLMIRGESAVGERIASNARDELDMIEDEVVLDYVNDIGQDLAELGGRTEFEYEFYVVAEDELNAFALPGGKIFINAGAITRTDTGAELAGLIAHELAHAILSHGFQQVTRGNLTANVLQAVPYGGLVTNLTVLRYSRDMERQADRLGTRLLASSPYAADGLRNLMQTLLDESGNSSRFDWLSTHPDTPERIRNLERLIERNGYNRYAFEDVERHLRIRERVKELLIEMGKIDLDLEDDEEPDQDNSQEPNLENSEEPDLDDSEETRLEDNEETRLEDNEEPDLNDNEETRLEDNDESDLDDSADV